MDKSTLQQIERIAEVCKRIKPLVVISCITYNHEPYLRDALEGFVMQQTNFPIVAIVHDDASTDGSADIIREYAVKYPDLILPVYEIENQYSKHDCSLSRIMIQARAATGARYAALCEGDDYWINPHKLQKQVDFLEAHPDYSLCFHNAMVHYEDGVKPDCEFAVLETREYTEHEIAGGWITATASFCFKTSVYYSSLFRIYAQSDKFLVGDYPLVMCLLREGKAFAFSEVMSVYRINPTGWTQRYTPVEKLIWQEIEANRIFGGACGVVAKKNAAIQSREAISLFAKGCFVRSMKILLLSLNFAPWLTIKENAKFVVKLLMNRLFKR